MKPHTLMLAALAAALVLAVPASADAATSSTLSMRAKITTFRATASGVVADGTLTGRLRSGTSVARDRAAVRFRVAAKRRGRRCDVITLRLAPLDLELLGVQVNTSHIKLDVYAHKGRVPTVMAPEDAKQYVKDVLILCDDVKLKALANVL